MQRPSASRQHSVRLRVTTEELEFLRRLAEAEDRSISSVLRRALRDLYERQAKAAA
jgi:predicted transcriptional regulator